MAGSSVDIYRRPAELLQNLVRYDTTNPPGNERECVAYIDSLLTEAGFQTSILAKDPNRTNLVARLEGRGDAPPLLLYGHVDVVTTSGQQWSYPPFEGQLVDGWVWGRGVLDMKGGVAMMLAALLRTKAEGLTPAGDVIFAALSDEEASGENGAKYLVENHPQEFDSVRYAVGEFGGFPFYMGSRKFYPLQVAEKQICWMKASIMGPGGHASLPLHGGTMAKLGKLLYRLDTQRLPVHVTPVVRQMLETMVAEVDGPVKSTLTRLLDPEETDAVLDEMGEEGLMFDALLHNTVEPTVVRGGDKINVLPSEIVVKLDARLLPGFGPDDLVAELRQIIGDEIALELIRYEEVPTEADVGLYRTLTAILRDADPKGIPVPLLLFAASDGRIFSRLGIQTYGFLPMNLPREFPFLRSIHAADERIPVEAMQFGADVMFELLKRYAG